jgi:LuxR family maltose regulon positive regulatory protein
LVNDLAAVELDVVLVLDDFQLVTNPAIQEATVFLLERRPPGLRVVISTRAEPGFPTPRLRARGELSDIGVDQLRFSPAETLQLLTQTYHLGLSDDQIARLHERTEGWAAGLYLAALSVRGQPDPSTFIASFAGDDRQLADYLTGEVLDRQEPQVRRFLLQTSILDRFTAALCDAVTGGRDSARALEHLERADLFLVALDSARQWYRYHSLFAEVLRGRLAREMPEAARHRGRGRRRRGGAGRPTLAQVLARRSGRDRRRLAACPAPGRGRRRLGAVSGRRERRRRAGSPR